MNHSTHQAPPADKAPDHAGHGAHRRHRWMMFVCCIPMLAIVGLLYLTGTLSLGFVIAAVFCVLLMPLLHGGMSHGEDDGNTGR